MEPGLRKQRDKQSSLSEPLESSVGTDPSIDLKRIQRGLNLRPLFRTIRRNILLVASITMVLTFANAYKLLKAPTAYTGGFRLLVEPITGEGKLTDPSVLSRGGEVSSFSVDYPTLLQVLQSPTLLSKVADRLKARHPEITVESLNRDILLKNLVIQRIGTNYLDNTKLIDVTYKSDDPTKVKHVLKAFSEEYLGYSLAARKSRISGGVEFIQGQLPGLQKRVNDLQQQLQALQQQYSFTDPNTQGTELSRQALVLESQKRDTQREVQEQIKLYDTLQRQLKLSPDEAIVASVLSQDPRYQDILTQLNKVESELAVKSARFSSDSPVVEALQAQRDNLTALLEQETQQIVGQSLPNTDSNPQVLAFQNTTRLNLIQQLITTANQIQVLTARQQAVTQIEADLNQQIEQLPAVIRQYSNLQRELDIAIKALNQLTIQRDTLQVEAAQKEVPWQLVAEPTGNPTAADRGIKKKLPVGVVGGLLLGVVSAVLLEKIRDQFLATEDVQDAVKLPLMSVIPYDKSVSLGDKTSPLGWLPTPFATESPLFQESFSALFASLRFLEASRTIRSLVVGSASPQEGKTMVAFHLAQAAATMGQKVLLVDANFRAPGLHQYLEVSVSKGLADVLSQKLDPMDFVEQSTTPNLSVLAAGNITPESTRQLASSYMQQVVAQLRDEFDFVIYDTPHLLGISDTNFLTAYTDGLLLVVGVIKTKRSVLMQVLTNLQNFQLPVIGVVANHPSPGVKMSYGYQEPIYIADRKPKTSLLDRLKPGKMKLPPANRPDDALP